MGLSAMLANLRKMESDALDEDLELLREMEDPRMSKPAPKSLSKPSTRQGCCTHSKGQRCGAGHSDRPGEEQVAISIDDRPDSEYEDTLDVPDAKDDRGVIKKPYRKKGQKRTTRRTVMRPVKIKAALIEPTLNLGEAEAGNEGDVAATADMSVPPSVGEGEKKKAGKPRKISATAHANYKRLKIRGSNGARAPPKFGGRRR